MSVLVIAEPGDDGVAPATARTITAATAFPGPIEVLVAGPTAESSSKSVARIAGVSRVLWATSETLDNCLAEPVAVLIAETVSDYDAVVAPATTFGKNVLPRAAALRDTALVSDVVEIIRPGTYIRPIYSGNAYATVESFEPIQFLTIRPSAFAAALASKEAAPLKTIDPPPAWTRTRLLEAAAEGRGSRPTLDAARIIVSGGRGVGSAEQFRNLERLADRLGAAMGATRAAVDSGYIANQFLIGQTGKIVAPEVYFAIGISGAVQHTAGMRDSEVIVAINMDESAPIFDFADLAWVEDLETAVPELEAALAALDS